MVLFWLFCGAVLSSLALTVIGDEERVHELVKAAMLSKNSSSAIMHDQEHSGASLTPSKRDAISPTTAYIRIFDVNPVDSIRSSSRCAEESGTDDANSVTYNPFYSNHG